MTRNALLVTELKQDPSGEWLATMEELVLDVIDLPLNDARCVIEEVTYAD